MARPLKQQRGARLSAPAAFAHLPVLDQAGVMATIWDRVLDGNVEGARVLLENGVGVDTRNSLGETPLHLAARHGLEEMARVSLRCQS